MEKIKENFLQHEALIPGLPDDLALKCLVRISHGYHGLLECVSKKWRDAIRSEEYARLKALEGLCGNWIFISTANGSRWEAYDTEADRWEPLPIMPAIGCNSVNKIIGFSCVTVCHKFLVIGGQTVSPVHQEVLSDVAVFDSFKKEWYMAAGMTRARLGFACVAISAKVYVAGGHNFTCPSGFSDAEVYDPCIDRWDYLPAMPFPLVGCFGLSRGKHFYVVGRKEPRATQYTHILFSIQEQEWQVLENTDPYINFGLSSIMEEMVYFFDEETIDALGQKEFDILCSCPALFLPDHERPLRPSGACLVGSKRRLYLIGGLTIKFDTQSRSYSVVQLNSTRFCEVTRLSQEWQNARPMLSQAGRVLGCAVMTE
ncbi:hypothetical protein LUZ61_003803 [Rhynchospora tenuis]|uniref:F-box domain-containing protein n=1 Tax=Rhynchospora tenuis TaxID=198213 RepID=A0AAD5ZLK7_9POAL|nr:hypothetical protein LUZ61_003803 [Rhynchospora tenuis]